MGCVSEAVSIDAASDGCGVGPYPRGDGMYGVMEKVTTHKLDSGSTLDYQYFLVYQYRKFKSPGDVAVLTELHTDGLTKIVARPVHRPTMTDEDIRSTIADECNRYLQWKEKLLPVGGDYAVSVKVAAGECVSVGVGLSKETAEVIVTALNGIGIKGEIVCIG